MFSEQAKKSESDIKRCELCKDHRLKGYFVKIEAHPDLLDGRYVFCNHCIEEEMELCPSMKLTIISIKKGAKFY